ncbi:unnamed protein product [Macrosiphum euphorbiae]|uniref:Uncharacterized protein n=1 Tax=Macrosiphum euphorbiae TaxID=13131 RepID=A0AAV0Y004_9HEMI|nr:unnamed protein product [Macrosiphum euphorbiae]
MSEEVMMTTNIESEEKKDKDLNGDFENNLAENKKEMDLMEIDDENNDKVNKNIAEKDNGAINKLKEIDNVSNAENEIPLIILDDEEDDNTITIKVVKKENENMMNKQLMKIDDENNDKVNKNTSEKDNGAINKLKETDNVSNVKKEIPLIKLQDKEKKEKEGHNEEKDLNGDFENNLAENDKTEMDDCKNKQLMKIDDENNDKVNKNTSEKDNGAINKLKETDNVSNVKKEIPLIKLQDEEKKEKEGHNEEKDLNGDLENNLAENKKEMDLMEIDDENNDKVNKNIAEKDNGAINKLKEIDNVSNAENEIPLIILDDEEDDNTITIKVVKKENDGGDNDTTFTEAKPLEKDDQEKEKLTLNNILEKIIEKTAHHEQHKEKDAENTIEKKAENDISNMMNNSNENENIVIVENNKREKDSGAINKPKEIDNVSNIEENDIPLITLSDTEDDNTITINVVRKKYDDGDKDTTVTDDGDKDTTVTDDKPEELELGENMIKDALLPKDNEQKSENDADKNSDEREIKLIECNDNSEEDISKKRKNDHEKGPQKRTKSQ